MNIHGLHDNKKEEKDDKKRQTYAGGSASGLALEDDIDKIIKKSRENTNNSNHKEEDFDKNSLIITLYSNGFLVNEDDFYDYKEEKSKKYLKDIEKGYLPDEIRNKYKITKNIKIGLSDKRTQAYSPPPKKFKNFDGEGLTIGNEIKTINEKVELKNSEINFNENEPFGQIKIRFANGETKVIKVNHNYKISDLYDFVTLSYPLETGFDLISGYPPKPLNDINLTVKEANLIGSNIIQKPIN